MGAEALAPALEISSHDSIWHMARMASLSAPAHDAVYARSSRRQQASRLLFCQGSDFVENLLKCEKCTAFASPHADVPYLIACMLI